MTYGFDTPIDFIPLERGLLSRNPLFSHTIPGALILALGALFGYWTLYMRPAPAPKLAKAAAPVKVASNPYGALFDPRSSSGSTPASSAAGSTPASLAQSFPLVASLESNPPAPSAAIAEPDNVAPAAPESAESAPLPIPRPADLGPPASQNPFHGSSRRLAQQNEKTAPATASGDNRSFFEKLFGMVQPSSPSRSSAPSRQVLAYAAPEDGGIGAAQRLTAPPPPLVSGDRSTAIYDVSAHTVYMPDGTRLEAHSGLGDRIDDPRYVNERMRGATPPSVYELTPREQLFHGVKALRLTPVGGGNVYGRTGLLAHRYMLGPNGDSNGCVSFKNYNAFLQAFENGEVKRLVVVAHRG